MIVVMSPAFFKSAPCFHEQLEARKNGLQVIPLLFQLEENGNPPGAVKGGGAKWIEACENMAGGEDEQAAHDTLCAFRLRATRTEASSSTRSRRRRTRCSTKISSTSLLDASGGRWKSRI